jgi:hypothetical protein
VLGKRITFLLAFLKAAGSHLATKRRKDIRENNQQEGRRRKEYQDLVTLPEPQGQASTKHQKASALSQSVSSLPEVSLTRVFITCTPESHPR